MTITKTAMGKLFADLNPEDVGAMAAALADFAQVNRPNSGHRLPEALAVRFRDFAIECGVSPSAVTVAEPSFGFCAVRFKDGADFLAALRALGLATGVTQVELAVNGPAELISKCADTSETPVAAAPAPPRPAPLVPAVAGAFSKAVDRFLDELGPLAAMPSDICTPDGWYNWTCDEYPDTDDAPYAPCNLDVGEFTTCLRELRTCRGQQKLPSISAIETALIYLDMAPKRPDGLDRVFYALAFNAEQPTIGRYVTDGETLPDFRLLLADLPGQQFCTDPLHNPLRRPDYLSDNTTMLEALRRDKGAAAFLCFGSAFLARKAPEALAFASDSKAFWGYVRDLYMQWVALGDPDIGAAFRDNKLKLVFHPFSRIGVRHSSDNHCGSYADVSELCAIDNALVASVPGEHDSDLRSGEFDYTNSDDEDGDDREERFETEHRVFEATAAAAVYGFAVVPGTSGVTDGIVEHDAFHIVRNRAPVEQSATEDDESADDRIGVDDLPLEWSTLIHGLDVRTVPELREMFTANGWADRLCWSGNTDTGFPVDRLDNAGCKLDQPNMTEFLSETLHAFRTMANNACATVPIDDQKYTVAEAHDRNKYVTAVYTGMTVSTSPAFNLGDTPETFSVPAMLYEDIVRRQSFEIANNIDPEDITNWLEHLSAHPEVQLKCAKRKSGDTSSRMAWVVVETNLPSDVVRQQCNNLYIGDSARCARDIVRSLFADTVLRGTRDPFNRFFRAAPEARVGDDAMLASVAAKASGCQNLGAATRVAMSQVPSMFTAENVITAWYSGPGELRKHVGVSFASDLHGRLVLVVAVDGTAAQVARLRYRAADPDKPRFGVFTASMMRAYCSMLDNPESPFDVFIPSADTWTDARPKMFRAVAGAACYGDVLAMDPPRGGLTMLMMAPRGDYSSEEAFPRSVYAPVPGVRVVNGGVEELRGFQSNMPF